MGKVGNARRKSRTGKRRNEIVLEIRGPEPSSSATGRDSDELGPGSICLNLEMAQQRHTLRKTSLQIGAWSSRPNHGYPSVNNLSRVGVGSIDPFATLSFDMDSQASDLCYKCKPNRITIVFDHERLLSICWHDQVFSTNQNYTEVLRTAWSFAGFYDEMAFRTFLSNSSIYLAMLRSGTNMKKDTNESLRLYTKALSLLCKKLDDPAQHTSDGLIGGMSGFLFHDVGVTKALRSLCSMAYS